MAQLTVPIVVDWESIESYRAQHDIVEVVRCKECRNRSDEDQMCCGRGWPYQLVVDDGFCEKGKRR